MTLKLKPLSEQVMVVLGASSGIGRETALQAAARGAAILVAARNEAALSSLVAEITKAGGKAAYAVCDVTDEAQVRQVARDAVARFGGIDTWVNVAGVSVYALFEDTSPEEFRRIMEVNFMGQVHGAQAALPHLRQRGGALIAISSVESIVSLPLHSAYSASKHAVEGVMDALRRELMAEGAPVSVTSIKPATINTPFFSNSRSKLDVMPKGPPPFYDPKVVADCVLYAAEHPMRDLFAGGAGRTMATNQMMAPRMMDMLMAKLGIPASKTETPAPDGQEGNLYSPYPENRTRGDFTERARSSVYTWWELHPLARALAVGGAITGTLLLRQRKATRRLAAKSAEGARPDGAAGDHDGNGPTSHDEDAILLVEAALGERQLVTAAPMDDDVPIAGAAKRKTRAAARRPKVEVEEPADGYFPAVDPPARP